ncbi:hypothetical protein THAOC_26362, partial [Thalassiosira oceanica]
MKTTARTTRGSRPYTRGPVARARRERLFPVDEVERARLALREAAGYRWRLRRALRAVFALLPSASRIVESAHGMMRDFYDPQMPTQILNAK